MSNIPDKYSLHFDAQGLLFSTADCLKTPLDFVRLWLHETSRVYGDKMIESGDMETLSKFQIQIAKDNFSVSTMSFKMAYSTWYFFRIWMKQHLEKSHLSTAILLQVFINYL